MIDQRIEFKKCDGSIWSTGNRQERENSSRGLGVLYNQNTQTAQGACYPYSDGLFNLEPNQSTM